jgi:hypothetical protein
MCAEETAAVSAAAMTDEHHSAQQHQLQCIARLALRAVGGGNKIKNKAYVGLEPTTS